jgi:hypothetical protein
MHRPSPKILHSIKLAQLKKEKDSQMTGSTPSTTPITIKEMNNVVEESSDTSQVSAKKINSKDSLPSTETTSEEQTKPPEMSSEQTTSNASPQVQSNEATEVPTENSSSTQTQNTAEPETPSTAESPQKIQTGKQSLRTAWKRVQPPFGATPDQMLAFVRKDGLRVIMTPEIPYPNGQKWAHVSLSRQHTMPSYYDLIDVKREFIGEEHKAIMVFPKKEEHVNIHKYCLHLWVIVENDPLPDFTEGSGMI